MDLTKHYDKSKLHLYGKHRLYIVVKSLQIEIDLLNEQLEKREKTQVYIETCNQRCLETLYKEIHELKQENKILKQEKKKKEEEEEEDLEALRCDEMF